MKKGIMFIVLTLLAQLAMAKGFSSDATIGDIADHASSYVPDMTDLMSAIAYVAGVGFGIMSALKLKENADTNGKSGMAKPIIYFICCAIFIALPSYINMGTESVGLKDSRQATKYW